MGMNRFAAWSACACIAVAANPATAQSYRFSIPAGTLKTALDAYVRQSGRQLIYRPTDVQSVRSRGVHGQLTAAAALVTLLDRTGFTARQDRSGAVAITPSSATPPTAAPARSDAVSATGGSDDEDPSEAKAADVVVTGSRLATGFSSPTPVSVLSAARLEARASTNIGDALNELPSFRASTTPATQISTSGYAGGRILDLRGLGAPRTLTLIDGKRFVPSTTQGTVDTNLIPSILLDRAEVVTGGASAAYGSDAVAGVVNLILDKRLQGLKGQVQAGLSRSDDDGTRQIGLAYGSAIGSTIHVVVGGEYERSDGIGDCTARAYCRTETSNFGRTPDDLTRPANTITGQLRSSAYPFNGVTIPSGYAKEQPILGPLGGITFGDNGTPQYFQYGSLVNSISMVGGQGANQNALGYGVSLYAPTERYAAMGHVEWNATPAITASIDVNYGRLTADPITALYYNIFTIRRDNAFISTIPVVADPRLNIAGILAANPQIAAFPFGRAFNSIGNTAVHVTNEVIRVVPSLAGSLGGSWKWDAYYQYGRDTFTSTSSNDVIRARALNAVDSVRNAAGQIVCRINATVGPLNDLSCVPLNPFNPQVSAAAQAYVTGVAVRRNVTTQNVAAANVRGNLLSLPYGKLAVSTGVEYRRDAISGTADPISQGLGFFTNNASLVSGRISVIEGYVEAEAPLLSGLRFANELSLNGAGRRTHYDRSSNFFPSSSVNATTWKIGGVYEPFGFIRFRATRSRDIRAPNVSELFGPVTSTTGSLNDPARGGLNTVATVFSGSNPTLKPEKANTFTAGIVLKPSGGFLGRFRVSVDYYDIKIADAIGTLGIQNIATRCVQGNADSCALITRDPVSGAIVSVRDTQQNVAKLITRGVDEEISYHQPLNRFGAVDVRLLGTVVTNLITVDAVGATDRAGQLGARNGSPLGVPTFIGDALLVWSFNNFSLNTHVRHIGSGFYDAALTDPGDPGYNVAATNSSNTNKADGRNYVDLVAQLKIRNVTRGDMTIYGGVNNLFNVQPPLLPGGGVGSGNGVLFDPVGQQFRIGVRARY